MMLDLPKEALVDKFVPKRRFYEKALINTKLKKRFQQDVKRITWLYKLSEETMGIDSTEDVEEIQIFELELKNKKIPKKVLKVIDKSIPYPILYIFSYEDDYAYGISLKDERNKYYLSKWNGEKKFNFSGINLETVYQNLVKTFIDKVHKEEKKFDEIVTIDQKIKSLEKEVKVLKNKISRESQFNKKVELNKKLHKKQDKLKELKKHE